MDVLTALFGAEEVEEADEPVTSIGYNGHPMLIGQAVTALIALWGQTLTPVAGELRFADDDERDLHVGSPSIYRLSEAPEDAKHAHVALLEINVDPEQLAEGDEERTIWRMQHAERDGERWRLHECASSYALAGWLAVSRELLLRLFNMSVEGEGDGAQAATV